MGSIPMIRASVERLNTDALNKDQFKCGHHPSLYWETALQVEGLWTSPRIQASRPCFARQN